VAFTLYGPGCPASFGFSGLPGPCDSRYTAAFGFSQPNGPYGPPGRKPLAHTAFAVSQLSTFTDPIVLVAFGLYGPNRIPPFSFGRDSGSCHTRCSLAHGLYGSSCTTVSGFGRTHSPRGLRPIWSEVPSSLQLQPNPPVHAIPAVCPFGVYGLSLSAAFAIGRPHGLIGPRCLSAVGLYGPGRTPVFSFGRPPVHVRLASD